VPSPIRALHCRDGIAGASFVVDDLDRTVDIVLVRVVSADGASERDRDPEPGERDSSVLTARAPSFAFPGTRTLSRSAVVFRYVRFGFEHVLSGIDHVLFMVALFWQAWMSSGRRTNVRRIAGELLRTATAFTFAHSLTLAATVLGWLRFPANIAEACIAASLVLVALDMHVRDEDTSPRDDLLVGERRSRIALAFAFGLVHGLGFAGALASSRLPEHAVALGLLSFNVGVELGQALVFTTAVLLLLVSSRIARGAGPRGRPRALALVSAYGVGVAGVAMFLARIATILRS
jgi:hypothetical protein